jgi:anti-sigma B factor antagonist
LSFLRRILILVIESETNQSAAFGIWNPEAIMDAFANPRIGPWGRQTMPLEITQREVNGIYLLALKGRLVLGQESSGVLTMVDNLLASGATRIVINLEQVNYVDSAGLGALIEMHRKTKAKGGALKLCNLGPNLRQALEMARLLPIFETCPTETAAVASF